MVLVTNNKDKEVNPENYDKIIYLGFTPLKKLTDSELVIDSSNLISVNNYVISLRGLCVGGRNAESKKDLESFYKRGIHQIVLGESTKQCSHLTETGEEIIFVPINGHKELN
jgi:hypothetical protein